MQMPLSTAGLPGGAQQRLRLGEYLVQAGALTRGRLRRILEFQGTWGGRLGGLLVQEKAVSETDLSFALAKQFNMPIVNLDQLHVSDEAFDLLPADLLWKWQIVPIHKEGKFLHIAISWATNFDDLDSVRARTGLNLREYFAIGGQVRRYLDRRAPRRAQIPLLSEGEARASSFMRDAQLATDVSVSDDLRTLRAQISENSARIAKDKRIIANLVRLCRAAGCSPEQVGDCFE